MSLKSRTIVSLFWKLLERAGNQVVLLLVQIVMARLLTPEDFGLLAIMLVFINIGNVFVQSGLGAALVQNPETTEADYSTVFWISLGISIVLFGCMYLCAPVIAGFYGKESIVIPLRALSAIMVINSFNSVQQAIVQRNMTFKLNFYATIISVLLSAVAGIGSALAGAGLWALVIQQIVYQSSNCIALAAFVRWVPRLVFDLDRASVLFSFGWKLLGSNVLNTGYSGLYDLVIGGQFSVSQLGLVSQGKKYPHALGNMLVGAIQPVLMSAVSKVQNDAERVKGVTRRSLKTSSFVVMPVMVLFALTADPVVRLLLGEQWVPCVWFMQIYCFTNALLPIHSANLSALCGVGRSDINLKLEIVKKIIGVCALSLGAFVFNDVHVLVSMELATSIICTFINAYPNKRIIGYTYWEQMRDISPGILLSMASAAAAWPICLVGLPDILLLLMQSIVMTIVYLGLSKLFHVEALEYLITTAKEMLGRK